jgi:hypothetical protein
VRDVLRGGEEVPLALDQRGPEAALDDVSFVSVPPVEPGAVASVEVLHPRRDVRLGRREQQVEVVRHQHVAVQLPAVPLPRDLEQLQKPLAIPVVVKQRQLPHTATDDVVNPSSNLRPKRSRQLETCPFASRLRV